MSLPAIKERFSQTLHTRKFILLFLSAVSVFSILIIFLGTYLFYFGYYRQGIPDQGLNTQIWFKGEKLHLISGIIIEKQGTVVTVDKNGEQLELDLGSKVFYCGEKEEEFCRLVETSEIRVGQLIVAHASRKWEENPELDLILGGNMRIHVWDN